MSSSAERMRRLRERRAAAVEPDPAAPLRDAADLLGPAIAETIAALDLGPEHAAAVRLAERYAKVIDRAQDAGYAARWIGPLLLDVLGELGATPAARARLDKGGKRSPAGSSWLDDMRRAHRTGGLNQRS
jgi:hypothetical protein